MAGSSISGRTKPMVLPARERQTIRRRVGAFIRKRRKELGLSMGDVVRPLGYSNLASAWKIEKGLEGLPTKRVYAWADILQVPRDAFFRFVTGEVERMEGSVIARRRKGSETDLLETYRTLPAKYQRRLREQAEEYAVLARASGTRRKP